MNILLVRQLVGITRGAGNFACAQMAPTAFSRPGRAAGIGCPTARVEQENQVNSGLSLRGASARQVAVPTIPVAVLAP